MYILINDKLDSIGDEELQRMLGTLPSWRRDKALRFKFQKGRLECALSYSMLADCLLKEYGISDPLEFEYGEHGKPSLKGHSHIHFNISHCNDAIAVAVDDAPIGVDVESIGRYSEGVGKYSMNDDELKTILSSENRELEFTRLWTQKEAVLKLLGTGITDDIKSVLSGLKDITIETSVHPTYVVSVAYKTKLTK